MYPNTQNTKHTHFAYCVQVKRKTIKKIAELAAPLLPNAAKNQHETKKLW